MSAKEIEAALARGIDILIPFLPIGSFLHFPLLYSVCVWGAKRIFDFRERILSWRAWIDPDNVKTKPDEFVLHFFAAHSGLSRAYRSEIAACDIEALRAAFPAFYSLCGLEDPFLKGLFRGELDSGDFRTIASEFPGRAAAACEAVLAAGAAAGFWKALRSLGMEIASLGAHFRSDQDIQHMITGVLMGKATAETFAE